MEQQKEVVAGDTVVEDGSYKLVANLSPFEITHLVLTSSKGDKRVWRVQELSEKDVSFKIEKFN